jgi:hypothetical protein
MLIELCDRLWRGEPVAEWLAALTPEGDPDAALAALWQRAQSPFPLLWLRSPTLGREELARLSSELVRLALPWALDAAPAVAGALDAVDRWAAGEGPVEDCVVAHFRFAPLMTEAERRAEGLAPPERARLFSALSAASAASAVPFVTDPGRYAYSELSERDPAASAVTFLLNRLADGLSAPDSGPGPQDRRAAEAGLASRLRVRLAAPRLAALSEAWREARARPEVLGRPPSLPPLPRGADPLRRLARVVLEVEAHPLLALERAAFGPPATPSALAEAAERAGGALPEGMEALYSLADGFSLAWQLDAQAIYAAGDPALVAAFGEELEAVAAGRRDPFGLIELLPLSRVFGDWKDVVWFDFDGDDTYRRVKPFDFFVAEACAALYPVPGEAPGVYFHSRAATPTGYSFAEYIELLSMSRGFWYWQKSLLGWVHPEAPFFRAMPRLFPGFEPERFRRRVDAPPLARVYAPRQP